MHTATHTPEASPVTVEEARERAAAAKGSWFSALTYDPFLKRAERAGMAARRAALLATAQGTVLELGAGTGLNAPHYPDGLDRLVLAEPQKHMAERLERRVARLGRRAQVVLAPADALPFESGSFDTVVSTLVLCTVPDPLAALAEARRVLKADGALLFLEHVRSDDPRLARRQDRLRGAWEAFGDGCRCNQPTLDILQAAGFATPELDRAQWRRMPSIVRPLISGRATPA